MTELERLKKERRELDAKIKELSSGDIVRRGTARYEHRKYPTGKQEHIIAVCRPRELRNQKYSEWWGQMLNAKTKEDLIGKLRVTLADLQELLESIDAEFPHL